jgi:hypothetical protein
MDGRASEKERRCRCPRYAVYITGLILSCLTVVSPMGCFLTTRVLSLLPVYTAATVLLIPASLLTLESFFLSLPVPTAVWPPARASARGPYLQYRRHQLLWAHPAFISASPCIITHHFPTTLLKHYCLVVFVPTTTDLGVLHRGVRLLDLSIEFYRSQT